MGWRFFTTSGYQTLGKHPTFGVLGLAVRLGGRALVALVVGVPIARSTTSLFLSEYAPSWSRRTLIALVDLAAAVPSVIYGLWGIFELQPNVVGFSTWLSHHLGFIPIFKVVSPPVTSSLFIAGLVVGIMIVPIIASITRGVFSLAPPGEREGSIGPRRHPVPDDPIGRSPFRSGGMIGAIMLGLGRALGETMPSPSSWARRSPSLPTSCSTADRPSPVSSPSTSPPVDQDRRPPDVRVHSLSPHHRHNLAASAVVNRSRSGAGIEL